MQYRRGLAAHRESSMCPSRQPPLGAGTLQAYSRQLPPATPPSRATNLFVQPGEELDDGDSVPQMGLPHAHQLGLVFDGFPQRHGAPGFQQLHRKQRTFQPIASCLLLQIASWRSQSSATTYFRCAGCNSSQVQPHQTWFVHAVAGLGMPQQCRQAGTTTGHWRVCKSHRLGCLSFIAVVCSFEPTLAASIQRNLGNCKAGLHSAPNKISSNVTIANICHSVSPENVGISRIL